MRILNDLLALLLGVGKKDSLEKMIQNSSILRIILILVIFLALFLSTVVLIVNIIL